MYKLINGKKVYETSEVDATTSRIEGVAQLAEGMAREASATANAISDTANKALEDAAFAKEIAVSHDEAITEITQAATQSLDKAMEAKAIAEATDAKATAAVATANEALTEATNHVIYTNTLPTTDIKNKVYAVKHSYNIINDISARADDILGSYFHLVSKGKYVIDDVYTLQYRDNNEWCDIGSIYLSDETLNCYLSKDFSSLYTWTLNLGDTYNFRLTTVMNHWDYYAGNETEQSLTKLANAQQVEDLFLKKTLAGTPGGLATLDGDGKILITQLPINTTIFRGNWDASTGTYPASTGITPGDWYLVSVAGTIGNTKYAINDRIMWSGTAWVKQTSTGEVVSVNGRSNVVTGLMEATNPVGTGSFSMNRKVGTTVGINSFAEGAETTASFDCTHAEGWGTIASSNEAHAEGHQTKASGQYSHAEGWGTIAAGQSQHAAGQWNIADSTSARITGWGTNGTSRKNIEQLDASGNLHLKGSVYVGCNDDSSGGIQINASMFPARRMYGGMNGNTRYATIKFKHVTPGGILVTTGYNSNLWFDSNKGTPYAFSSSTAYGVTGYAWSSDGNTLYLRFGNYNPIAVTIPSLYEGDGIVTFGELSSTAPSGVTFLTNVNTIASNAVSYNAQTLTDAQKTQARNNIGAGTGLGTITGIKMNGASKGTSGVVDLGDVPTLLDIYPVGAVYISVNNTNPSSLFGGTWESIGAGRVLQGADSSHKGGTTINAGLPNITGTFRIYTADKNNEVPQNTGTGAFTKTTDTTVSGESYKLQRHCPKFSFNANDGATTKGIYGNSTTVQPPAYCVYMWKRTA